MRRAFVGFSSPIGYCYKRPAKRTINDQHSSPNPVLAGGLGLAVLFDEIWFACESLCPQNMRALPYVKFLDREKAGLDLKQTTFDQEEKKIQTVLDEGAAAWECDEDRLNLSVIMEDYRRPYTAYACDNHSHGMTVFGLELGGNPDSYNLAKDVALISRFKELDLSIVLNPHTGPFLTGDGSTTDTAKHVTQEASALAERVLRLTALPERPSAKGPYHPIVEELRNDGLIVQFRKWMDDKSNRLDNKDVAMISADVNACIQEFGMRAAGKLVEGKPLAARTYELFKDSVLKQIPLLSPALKWAKGVREEQEAEAMRWQAFIARARLRIEASKPVQKNR